MEGRGAARNAPFVAGIEDHRAPWTVRRVGPKVPEVNGARIVVSVADDAVMVYGMAYRRRTTGINAPL